MSMLLPEVELKLLSNFKRGLTQQLRRFLMMMMS